MPSDGAEQPILITSDLLDSRVDFERGMSLVPAVSLLLLAVQVSVFVVSVARGSLFDETGEILIAMGALESGAVRGGELWRLWSCTLLHGGIDHLLGNALALYIVGMACEHAFGRLQFVFLYLGAALCGSGLSALHLQAGMPAVGASGAIFGLMGATVVVLLRNSKRLFVRDKRAGVVVAAWIGYSILTGFLTPFIDNAAHIGGLIGGSAIAFMLRPRVLEKEGPASVADWAFFLTGSVAMAALSVPWIRRLAA